MTDDAAPRKADLLIKAGCIITVDEDRRILRDAAIAIAGNRIAAIGPAAEVLSGWSATRVIDASDSIVTPGLIDAHSHPIDYLIKGLCDDTPQFPRLRERVIPYEDGMNEEEAYASSLATFAEMIRCGTTSFFDAAGPHPAAIVRAAEETGVRGIVTRKIADVPGPFGGHVDDPGHAIAIADETVERFHGAAGGRIRAGYDLDLPQVVSDRVAEHIAGQSAERGLTVVSHLIGRRPAPGEPEEGNPDVARLDRLGLLHNRTTLAHIGWLPQADIDLLAERSVNIAHCPAASLVGGNGWAVHGVIPELVAAGANIVLGTDAAAIARTMDMVRIMNSACLVHKDARRDPLLMNPHHVFEMATIAGARAMGWADGIGSLEVGKLADLACFRTSAIHWWPAPFANPVPDLIYSGSGQDAHLVLVNGQILMEDGIITGLDLDRVRGLVRQAAASTHARLGMAPAGRWP